MVHPNEIFIIHEVDLLKIEWVWERGEELGRRVKEVRLGWWVGWSGLASCKEGVLLPECAPLNISLFLLWRSSRLLLWRKEVRP